MNVIVEPKHVSFEVRDYLISKGLWIANCIGNITPLDRTEPVTVIGLLVPPVERYTKFLFFKRTNRARFVGALWLDNSIRGARLNERWILEVYGDSNIDWLSEIAEELNKKFDRHIYVRCEDLEERREYFMSDGGY